MQLIAEKDDGSRWKIADVLTAHQSSHMPAGYRGCLLHCDRQTAVRGGFLRRVVVLVLAPLLETAVVVTSCMKWETEGRAAPLWWLCIATITYFLTSLCFWFLIFSGAESISPGCRLLLCVFTSWKEKTQKGYLTFSLWEFVTNLLVCFQLKLVVSDYFLFFPGVAGQHLENGIIRQFFREGGNDLP